jgi:hypothetical protein
MCDCPVKTILARLRTDTTHNQQLWPLRSIICDWFACFVVHGLWPVMLTRHSELAHHHQHDVYVLRGAIHADADRPPLFSALSVVRGNSFLRYFCVHMILMVCMHRKRVFDSAQALAQYRSSLAPLDLGVHSKYGDVRPLFRDYVTSAHKVQLAQVGRQLLKRLSIICPHCIAARRVSSCAACRPGVTKRSGLHRRCGPDWHRSVTTSKEIGETCCDTTGK